MSTPIKPAGAGSLASIIPQAAPEAAVPNTGVSPGRGAALERAEHVEMSASPAVGESAAVEALLHEVEAGRLDAAGLIERLVDDALATLGPGLSAAERDDFVDFLQLQFESDPAISALLARLTPPVEP
ncbi:MAG: hypothetical protein ACPGUV_10120 [Polyangiales bacterium]